MDTAAPSPPRRSRELELHYSGPKALFTIIFGALVLATLAYGTFMLSGWANPDVEMRLRASAVVTLPFLLVYLFKVWTGTRVYRWQGPVLRLDARGITDHRRGGRRIPWCELDNVYIAEVAGRGALVLEFRDFATARGHMGWWRMPIALVNRIMLHGHWYVPLAGLAYRGSEVSNVSRALLAANRFPAAALRQ